METDSQLLANGVTTAFHGLTWSWEPGLRGRQAARAFVEALAEARASLGCDTKLHLRFETHNLEDLGEVADLVLSGRVDLLAFNDHTGHLLAEVKQPRKLEALAGRCGIPPEDYRARLAAILDQAPQVPAACRRLSALAKGAIPMASHDDDTPEIRAGYRALGCSIAEFPTTVAAALAAREHGDHVVMGAPNVLRGGSHIASGMDGRDIVAQGLCDVLASDYYYPALLEAPFVLENQGILPLEESWKLVSENPARATGLADRGRLAPGLRADIIVVDASALRPRVVAVVAAGRLVLLAGQAAARLMRPGAASSAEAFRDEQPRVAVCR